MNTSTWKISAGASQIFRIPQKEGGRDNSDPCPGSSPAAQPGVASPTPGCSSPAQSQPQTSKFPLYLPTPACSCKMVWIRRYKMMFCGLSGVLHLRNSLQSKGMPLAVLPCPSPSPGMEHSWLLRWSKAEHCCSFR